MKNLKVSVIMMLALIIMESACPSFAQSSNANPKGGVATPKVTKQCWYPPDYRTPMDVGCECGTAPALKYSCDKDHNCVPQDIEPHKCDGPIR
jgi:hypothetical protein